MHERLAEFGPSQSGSALLSRVTTRTQSLIGTTLMGISDPASDSKTMRELAVHAQVYESAARAGRQLKPIRNKRRCVVASPSAVCLACNSLCSSIAAAQHLPRGSLCWLSVPPLCCCAAFRCLSHQCVVALCCVALRCVGVSTAPRVGYTYGRRPRSANRLAETLGMSGASATGGARRDVSSGLLDAEQLATLLYGDEPVEGLDTRLVAQLAVAPQTTAKSLFVATSLTPVSPKFGRTGTHSTSDLSEVALYGEEVTIDSDRDDAKVRGVVHGSRARRVRHVAGVAAC